MLFICASRTSRNCVQSVVPAMHQGRRPVVSNFSGMRIGVILSAVAVAAVCLPAAAQYPTSDFFPIGVHSQPKASFDKWKARGVNALFQYEAENNGQGVPSVSIETWS